MNATVTKAARSDRKPRLALMGEFSAGKSTLSNLLLGADPLPVRVTATRLPPVWISYGETAAYREDLSGNVHPIDVTHLEEVHLEDTKLIRLSIESDILRLCDLIDMPGISDPNMASDVWKSTIGEADNVIWCTHATQAWRQSEASVWESLPEALRAKSLLLMTRFDKILTTRDRDRVQKRIQRETKGLFGKVFPISLTNALAAGEDHQAWRESGADAFVTHLIDMLMNPDQQPVQIEEVPAAKASPTPQTVTPEAPETSTVRVMPSRVRSKSGGQRRPRCTPRKDAGNMAGLGKIEMPGNI